MEITQEDIKMRWYLQKLPWGISHGHTILNHKICQLLQPDFNFGFGSWNSKSSPCHVPRET